MQREQGIVRNAILARVEQVNLNTTAIHVDLGGNIVVTQRIDAHTKTLLADAVKTHQFMESKIVSKSSLFTTPKITHRAREYRRER